MRAFIERLQALEFQARIFVSFGIVALVAGVSFPGPRSSGSMFELMGKLADLPPTTSLRIAYALAALLMVLASLLRMWAGSALSSARMMAFRVQKDELVLSGPYLLVRHPIYLADFVAFSAFALCLRPVGLLLPALLWLHYRILTLYEERALRAEHGVLYAAYASTVPRFLPDRRSLPQLARGFRFAQLTGDGVRHNALYVLFIPGFVVCAWTLSLVPALLIGLPAVLDWAIVHTIKGVRPQRPATRAAALRFERERCPAVARSRSA